MTADCDEETGEYFFLSQLMAAVLLFDKSPNAFHISSNEAYGFGPVAIEPGYKVGINDGNCSFTAILTTSKTCLLYTSPSPRDATLSRMPSSA